MTGRAGLRVVVFGATGNVGTAVVRSLARDPQIGSIIGVARRPPRMQVTAAFPRVTWRAVDITCDPLDLVAGADVVVHLAWKIQPSHNEALMRATNLHGSQRIIDAVIGNAVPSLVYASSVGAYGPGPKTQVDEHHPVTGIATSTYSRHKSAVEAMLDEVARAHPSLRVVRMRTSLVFQASAASEIHRLFLGPLVPWHLPRALRFVPDLDRLQFQAVHADDAADAYRLAIVGDISGPVNIAAEPVLTAAVIADAVGGRVVPAPVGLVRSAMALTHAAHIQPCEAGWLDMALQTPLMDTTVAQQTLGWRAAHAATEALRELFDGIGSGAGGGTEPLKPRRAPSAWRPVHT